MNEVRRQLALDMQTIVKVERENNITKFTNMGIHKILSWETQVMTKALQSLDGKPEIFDDFDENNYEEITF